MPTDTRNSRANNALTSEDLNKLGKDINNAVDLVRSDILEIRNVIIKNLLDENNKLKTKVKSLSDKVESLEADIAAQDLYCRRNNIEFSGITNDVVDENLEAHVIKICKDIGVKVTEADIEACHRLQGKSEPKRTIVRFVNRKNCYNILKNRKRLPRTIYANANLNKFYHNIAYQCRNLKRDNQIWATWYDSSAVLLKIDEKSQPRKIYSMRYLFDLFPEYSFE